MAEQPTRSALLPLPAPAPGPLLSLDTCTDGCCAPSPQTVVAQGRVDDCCAPGQGAQGADDRQAAHGTRHGAHQAGESHGEAWTRRARLAKALAWASLVWMSIEGAFGLVVGIRASSIGLVGWALSSVVEGLASVIVIWRFTGSRTHSVHAEEKAQKAVAVSFWLLAPYVATRSVIDLAGAHHPSTTTLGMFLVISSIILMPALGIAKRRLGTQLESDATAGEGTQNLLCACLAAGVLVGLLANTTLGWWWVDAAAGLAVALVAVIEGSRAWQGEDCC